MLIQIILKLFNMNQKGQIGVVHLIGWGISIAAAAIGFSYTMINGLSEKQYSTAQDISALQAESKEYRDNIKSINFKLDDILNRLPKR